ncbi:MAG: hypothetical protein LV471_09600 [Nitrosomonas sp.]|nr:hypothetical protein [Nitrosomonas sp.]
MSNNFQLSSQFKIHGMQRSAIEMFTEKMLRAFQCSVILSLQQNTMNMIPDNQASQIILDEKARDAFYLDFLK